MKPTVHRFRVTKRPLPASPSSPVTKRSTAVQSCDRCRQQKKKCTKERLSCELCIAHGYECSFEIGLVNPSPSQDPSSRDIQAEPPNPDTPNGLEQHPSITTVLSHYPSKYVDAYFSHVHRAYPFLDKHQIKARVKALPHYELWTDDIANLVMAIGSTTLVRAGKLHADASFHLSVLYTNILDKYLLHPTMEGLQVLTLLSLYSLFDTTGPSTWTIVGILTRQATALGLSRISPTSEDLEPQSRELRNRLFWSIFTLDRMVAVSVGHDAGLVDHNMAVPQPAVTVLEFASQDRSKHASLLQLNRHIIQLRQLEHRILLSVHLRNHAELSKLTLPDRKAISSELRSAIDDWYSHACLVSMPEADNIPIHSTITWVNARYYNLLVLLYYPCHFNSQARYASTKELLSHVSKFINYNRILLDQRQLPLNHITLGRLLPACMVLLHCFAVAHPRTYMSQAELTSCIEILRAFPVAWFSAHQTSGIMTEFIELVASHEAHASRQILQFDYSGHTPLQSSIKTRILGLRDDLSGVIRRALSEASCYLDVEAWEDMEGAESYGSASQATGPSPDATTAMITDWEFELGYL
ncbi:hypothetical protein PMIN02_006595 [Paraphaeosphaeria minitans]|uniref:Protein STB5-like protein 3 n=1 Tax=Paraphaeosphaeria minitans TaxID=565426 RepID=A0A9P6KLA9_9PLEO|nr:Protein STB5-like protein 3 [Paraphaeosphaeria minitans]